MPFPLIHRPFYKQNNGKDEEVMVSIATHSERKDTLNLVIDSLLPQVDRLNVYLNGYDHIPDILKHPKVLAVLSQQKVGDLADNGKFFFGSIENWLLLYM